MTTELKPGLRWVRRLKQSFMTENYAWCISELKGHIPFLTAEIIYTTRDNPPDSDFEDIKNPEDWEWGPEIEIPAKDWIEIRAWKNND